MVKRSINIIKASIPAIFMVGMFFMYSCENDLEKVKVVSATDQTPDRIITDLHMIETDSGSVRFELIATRVEEYSIGQNKRLFKDGFTVRFYKNRILEAELSADYAELREDEHTFVARNQVIFTNFTENQTLKTEELFWDQMTRRVRTDKAYEIFGENSYAKGYGLDADETFSDYHTHDASYEQK